MPFSPPFLGEGSPTKIDYRQKKRYPCSNLSNLEDLVAMIVSWAQFMHIPSWPWSSLWVGAGDCPSFGGRHATEMEGRAEEGLLNQFVAKQSPSIFLPLVVFHG